jgi:predicted RNase H-like HicB family nuclease
MDWTDEQRLRALMRMPWTVRTERNESDGYFVARVVELPSVIATGATEKDLARDLWESLEASLSCYLEFNDPIPLPKNEVLPWERSHQVQKVVIHAGKFGEAWEPSAVAASGVSTPHPR